jgi:phosphatidylinositol-3,4,5-trisphosphate 3-phosphatase/dual-specificity protein phosphatase PTEN
VIVVHCNSGKGRTGTAIATILLFVGYFDNVDDCLRFYGHQRFTCGKGVSQPCQLRYLYYFEAFYRRQIKSPCIKRLRGVQFENIPSLSGDGCTPYFEVYKCQGLDIVRLFTFPPTREYKAKEKHAYFLLSDSQRNSWTMSGDIKILFRHQGFTSHTFCRIMFNTGFIQRGNYIVAGKMELSPEDIRKDKGKIIPNDFKIFIFFDNFCSKCSPDKTEIE